jgi:hypothetical protein
MTNVRDTRRFGFFMVNNEIMRHYARHISPSGLAVYCCLLMHASHDTGTCILRIKTVAERSGVSERTVKRMLAILAGEDGAEDGAGNTAPTLELAGLAPLISITHRFGEVGQRLSSEYTILQVAKDGEPGAPPQANLAPPQDTVASPWGQSDTRGVTQWPNNNKTVSNQTVENKTSPQTPEGAGAEDAASQAARKSKDDAELLERFDRFWAAYPKKAGKPDALRAWRSKQPDEATTERMIAAIAEHARAHEWTPERKRFIPYPATWLNQERWNDELEVDLPASAAATDRPAATIEEAAEIARTTVRFSTRAYLATTAHPMTPAQIERVDRGEPLEDVLTAVQLDLARRGRKEAHNRAMMFSRSGGNF